MPRSKSRRRSVAVLRWFGFFVCVALAAVGVYLVVTSTNDPKRIEVGVLLGLWGALVGAIVVFGSRSREPAPAPAPVPVAPPGQELDLRKIGEIERMAIANAVEAARREFRAELEDLLRREVQAGLAQEVAGLRAEVTALRNELVEKVGGQLRLERIETTRLIGSDLEALQNELRQLREIGAREAEPASAVHEAEIHEAEIVVERVAPPAMATPDPPAREAERVPEPQPEPAAQPTADLRKVVPPVRPEPKPEPDVQQPPAPDPVVARGPAPESVVAREPEPEPERAPEPAPVSVATPAPASADPFALMPRIRPFTDFELDPIPAADDGDEIATRAGRHASAKDDAPARGRRHRADDGGDDVLARILARESRH